MGTPSISVKPFSLITSVGAIRVSGPFESPLPSPVSTWPFSLIHGLFKVTDGIYQIRGMDLANMTIVEGRTGLIIIDPLLTPATAKAGLDLYLQHRPAKPVVAVIYTHSHADHFAGVKGVMSQADADEGRVRVYAPEGFFEHAVSENVIAGNAMTRVLL